ncbi:MAG: hypothetical protein SVV67_11305, partial [Bacillota bacterium]|nr:hypothetical protein [Bacillota bacterium]
GVVLGKSVVGWGLSWYNLTQALKKDTVAFDAPSSATRAIAALAAPGNEDAMLFADAADLSIDLLAGNARVYAYGTPTIEGVKGVTRAYDAVETVFTQPGVVKRFQEFQTLQTVWDDASTISERISDGNASGGFVLYPNKPNTNMMQQVYRK